MTGELQWPPGGPGCTCVVEGSEENYHVGFLPLSKSRMADIVICAWRAWLLHVLRVPGEETEAMAYGLRFHDVAALVGADADAAVRAVIEEHPEMAEAVEAIKATQVYPPEKTVGLEAFHALTAADLPLAGVELPQGMPLFRGILDRVVRDSDLLVVEELKSGNVVRDDPYERHLYCFLVHTAYGADRVQFHRWYPRIGVRKIWSYRYMADGHVAVVAKDPGDPEYSGCHQRLFGRMVDYVTRLQAVPMPSDRCRLLYGAPCRFYGTSCPATSAMVPSVLTIGGSSSVAARENMAALRLVVDSRKDDIGTVSAEAIVKARSASNALAAVNRTATARIKDWLEVNGPVPGAEGNRPSLELKSTRVRTFESAFLLRELLDAGLPLEDIAAVFSVSEASLRKGGPEVRAALRSILPLAPHVDQWRHCLADGR